MKRVPLQGEALGDASAKKMHECANCRGLEIAEGQVKKKRCPTECGWQSDCGEPIIEKIKVKPGYDKKV